MELIDTHSHLYLEHFEEDHEQCIERALDKNVNKIILPNIDSQTIKPLTNFCELYPEICIPLMGLHPTHVKENFREELTKVFNELERREYKGIGEIGIDLYWDKTFFEEQKEAFLDQINYSVKKNLPFVIHSRESFDEVIGLLKKMNVSKFKGIFHAFPGDKKQADEVIELGFKIGVGGVLTFKNSHLPDVVSELSLEHIVLETDSPYLTPVPFRGKRNESSYIPFIASKISEIKNVTIEEVAEKTTNNAIEVFDL